MYPASYLWTMITELLKELKLDDKYTVLDVYNFGYDPDERPSIWIEVLTRDAEGNRSGIERITRFIQYDVTYQDWGKVPTDYPVIV